MIFVYTLHILSTFKIKIDSKLLSLEQQPTFIVHFMFHEETDSEKCR